MVQRLELSRVQAHSADSADAPAVAAGESARLPAKINIGQGHCPIPNIHNFVKHKYRGIDLFWRCFFA